MTLTFDLVIYLRIFLLKIVVTNLRRCHEKNPGFYSLRCTLPVASHPPQYTLRVGAWPLIWSAAARADRISANCFVSLAIDVRAKSKGVGDSQDEMPGQAWRTCHHRSSVTAVISKLSSTGRATVYLALWSGWLVPPDMTKRQIAAGLGTEEPLLSWELVWNVSTGRFISRAFHHCHYVKHLLTLFLITLTQWRHYGGGADRSGWHLSGGDTRIE